MSENTQQPSRLAAYKNTGKNSTEMRQRRHEVTVELRKNKKDDQMLKRRNIEAEELGSPLQDANGQSSQPTLQLEEIVEFIHSGNPKDEFKAVQAIRKMLSRERNPPIDTVIGLNLVPLLIKFLDNFNDAPLQFEAAWALTNIASGTSDQTRAVIAAGAVPKFVKLLGSDAANVSEQAVWALGNVAGDGADARDIVLNQNVVDYLMVLIDNKSTEISFLRNIVWLMSNLCRNKNPTPSFDKVRQMLPALSKLLYSHDRLVLSDVCWALSYVTDDTPAKIQAVVDSGCIPRLVELLTLDDVAVVTPALRSVGNIVTGDDRQTDAVLGANVLGSLVMLLNHKKPNIIKEAAWTVSNITAGNQQQIQQVLEQGVVMSLVDVLKGSDFKAQREAVWAITNITSGGSTDQIIQLIEKYPVIQPFCDLLSSKDTRTLSVILTGLQALFKTAEAVKGVDSLCELLETIGGLDRLEALQNHENEEIYEKAYVLIDTYFSDAADEAKGMAPQEHNGAFTFNPQSESENGSGFSF